VNALPVIHRELRAQSRQAFTYWLRVAGAGAVIGMAVFFALNVGLRPDSGSFLFSALHAVLHVSIWVLVPLMAADCISRERREGTLGLLFLTPLKPRDLVAAKGTAQVLRAVTLLLAAVPVATLPALLGGVAWRQMVASVTINLAAICLALTASLLASAMAKSWLRALLGAYVWSAALAVGMCHALIACLSLALGRPVLFGFQNGFQLAIGINPEFFASTYYYRAGLNFMNGATTAQLFQATLAATGLILLGAVLLLLLALFVTAWITRRSWRELPPHPLTAQLQQWLCSPIVMQGVLQRWMNRSLTRNPVGWLQRRAWSGRLVIWSWLAVMVSLYGWVLGNASLIYRSLDEIHNLMGWLLVLSVAFSAAGSFRRERETGLLELLLVTPLNEWQIVFGRLRGLWGQFLPSFALLLAGWSYLALATTYDNDSPSLIFKLALAFVALPIIGLYFSLVCRGVIAALVWTLLFGVLLPESLLQLVRVTLALLYWHGLAEMSAPILNSLLHPSLLQGVLAGVLLIRLHQRLVHRNFATEASG
jgi:ABC-type transport system involved in multi-copper enzyme maturation permease subunit